MTRTDGTNTNHAVAEANWRKKMIDPIGQVWTPFGNVRGDAYSWTDARDPNDPTNLIEDDTIIRGTGQAGLLYSFPFVAHSGWASHIFEPTAQVVVRPNRIDQRRTPDEDARSLVFDDTLLFDIDKFSGYDRLETGHARQRWYPVHPAGQQWALCPCRLRAEHASVGGQCFCRSGQTCTDRSQGCQQRCRTSRRKAASRRIALTMSPACTCRPSAASTLSLRAASTRTIGRSAARIPTCRPTTGRSSHKWATPTRASTRQPGIFDTQQEILPTLGLPPDRQVERPGPDALRHRQPEPHSGPRPAQVSGRVLRPHGELHRDVRRESGA